ncbi:sporulation protein YabP [Thermotalea metallivorans]|uniref:Spore protein YabP n=1 Tax=Thermotalea metallivorans TaxID=520762 RepID=A0A140L083_9FIRM|nr:sporulation protein YabP [Thermotalea metallivorans]KXG73958.1 Spore protein YabP [Thermotalea metallivorans]
MEDKRVAKSKSHHLILENREKLSISGVEHVDSFNENTVLLETVQGVLTIKGNELNINKLNLDDGNVVVEGFFYSINYSDKDSLQNKGVGFLGKMFK